MRTRMIVVGLVAVVLLGFSDRALAQSCPCNCYFSGDCPGGQFCNWGSLPVEDTCFWRTPKPQGVPGANCDQDYDNWGQCDGICDGGGSSIFEREDDALLVQAAASWAAAINDAAKSGEGFPRQALVQNLEAIPLKQPTALIAVGRVVIETMMYARGIDFAVMPEGRTLFAADVAVQPDKPDKAVAQAAGLLMKILFAEIREAGSGQIYLAPLSKAKLDPEVLARICAAEPDPAVCVYNRIRVMGNAIGGFLPAGPRGAPTCNVLGDIDNDGDVDSRDAHALAVILSGGTPDPNWIVERADTNSDGVYDGRDVQGFVDIAMS